MKLNCHQTQTFLWYKWTEVWALCVLCIFFNTSFIHCVTTMNFCLNWASANTKLWTFCGVKELYVTRVYNGRFSEPSTHCIIEMKYCVNCCTHDSSLRRFCDTKEPPQELHIYIVHFVLYGCETWSLTLREERRLRVFENRVLREYLGLREMR